MSGKQIWVSPADDGWRVHKPGTVKDSARTDTKAEALEIAERIARNQNLDTKVQRADGKLSAEGNTYPRSRDKFPPRG
ncbi:MAG: DUF2188 domain-containing protein [Candidatus Berkelbacteria bacterium]|nr:DUF2188 domain-containing protein [Candidatus Berkelbacteria bacterium]